MSQPYGNDDWKKVKSGKWEHFTTTGDEKSKEYYVDGVLVTKEQFLKEYRN